MKIISMVLALLTMVLVSTSTVVANDKITSKVIFSGDWGKSIGQFGRDYSGKTMFEYELSLYVLNDEIYVLDSMNNRIQIFDNNGIYRRTTVLNTSWEKDGLVFEFTKYNNCIYALVGVPPSYSENGIKEIWKYSDAGKLNKRFGHDLISNKTDDYEHLFSVNKTGYMYVAVGGKKILAMDEQEKLVHQVIKAQKGEVVNFVGLSPKGNPIVNLTRSAGKIVHTMVIDKENNKVIETVNGRYSMADDKGKFVSVRTLSASKRERKPMLTKVEVYDSVNEKKEVAEFKGDIRVNKNGKEKVYRLAEGYFEASRMDIDGAIYHMLVLDDGVVIRKILFE